MNEAIQKVCTVHKSNGLNVYIPNFDNGFRNGTKGDKSDEIRDLAIEYGVGDRFSYVVGIYPPPRTRLIDERGNYCTVDLEKNEPEQIVEQIANLAIGDDAKREFGQKLSVLAKEYCYISVKDDCLKIIPRLKARIKNDTDSVPKRELLKRLARYEAKLKKLEADYPQYAHLEIKHNYMAF
jgi:hypothetical protein